MTTVQQILLHDQIGEASFDFVKNGEFVTRHRTLLSTEITTYTNALAALAVADILKIDPEDGRTGTERFPRYKPHDLNTKVNLHGVTVIDDYAHHPTEITASLTAAKHYPHREIWCIFQPHTYTRTKALFPEFAEALSHTDHVILADIYAARETDTLGISSKDLADAIAEKGADCILFSFF